MLELTSPAPPRSPWQLFYGAALAARRRYWRRRSRRLPRPTVSIGNLHWGGAGKTPLVAALASHLRERGSRVVILSRGYRRKGRGISIVSTGAGPQLDPRSVGDEPVLLATELPGVAVLVGADRHAAGLHALEHLRPAPDLFLLDDGFSHVRLWRDLDLLAFPVADPFGGGRLLPRGRLREPLAASRHADAVLLTGGEEAATSGEALAGALRLHGFSGPGFACPFRTGPLKGPAASPPAGSRVLLTAGIARFEPFATAVRRLGYAVGDSIVFPDHYPYPEASLRRIEQALVAARAAAVVTTAKDAVKLEGRLAVPLVVLPLRAEPEEAFWTWLAEALARLER